MRTVPRKERKGCLNRRVGEREGRRRRKKRPDEKTERSKRLRGGRKEKGKGD